MAADKYVALVSGALTNTSATQAGGGANAGKIVALNDTTGLLDATMIPAGTYAAPTVSAVAATGDIANGDLVYITGTTGALVANKAQANAAATLAQGFVIVGAAAGNAVTINMGGFNTAAAKQGGGTFTIGVEVWLDEANAGKIKTTAPTTGFVQPVGVITESNTLYFARQLAVAA